jgi:hypothetical protein
MTAALNRPYVPGLLAFVLSACGGAGSAPVISNLVFSPTSAVLNQSGGLVVVSAQFDFEDPDGDLTAGHVATSSGEQLSVAIQGLDGVRSGTLAGGIQVSTANLGRFTFQLWVSDSRGNQSNRLSATFDVLNDDTATNWTVRSSGVTGALWRAVYSGSQYVAVGDDGAVVTSPDSIAWTSRSSGTASALRGLAWSGTQFVAVGDSGTIIASVDGATWSARSSGMPTTATLNAVAWSGAQFLAVGNDNDPPSGRSFAVILTSPDGVTWTQQAPGLSYGLNGVARAGNRVVAVGETLNVPTVNPAVLVSSDGVGWSGDDTGLIGGYLKDVASNGSLTVAVGYISGAITSTDGIHWQQVAVGTGSWNAVAWNGTRFLVCGTIYCSTTTDGLSWLQTQLPSGTNVLGVTWGDQRWIGVGSNGVIVTSP